MSLFDRQDDFTEIKENSDALILPHRWNVALHCLSNFILSLERNSTTAPFPSIEPDKLIKCFTIFSRRASYEWSYQRALAKYQTMEALKKKTLGTGVSFPNIDAPEHHPYLELPFVREALVITQNLLNDDPFMYEDEIFYPITVTLEKLREKHAEYDIESVIIGVYNAKNALSRFYPGSDE
jgi:hypothetical protein